MQHTNTHTNERVGQGDHAHNVERNYECFSPLLAWAGLTGDIYARI